MSKGNNDNFKLQEDVPTTKEHQDILANLKTNGTALDTPTYMHVEGGMKDVPQLRHDKYGKKKTYHDVQLDAETNQRITTIRSECADILGLIDQESEERNRLTMDEWSHFAPLFRKSVADTGLEIPEFVALYKEYKERIDTYRPIKIYKDASFSEVFMIIHPQHLELTPIPDHDPGWRRYANELNDTSLSKNMTLANDILLASLYKYQDIDEIKKKQVEMIKSVIVTAEKVSGKKVEALTIDGVTLDQPKSTKSDDPTKGPVEFDPFA